MKFGDIAALALAYSDLAVVTDVIHAINANLPKTGPLGTIPAATRSLDPRPRLRATPQRHFSARQVLRPDAGEVDHRRADVRVDRYEPSCCEPLPTSQTVIVEANNRTVSPFLPVWATLPPVRHVTAARVVKVVYQKVDLLGRGSLLDVFV